MNDPHNTDLEQQILGGLLHDNGLLTKMHGVTPDAFYDPVHGAIFKAVQDRIEEGKKADAVTMRFEMAALPGLQDLGGTEYLVRLQISAIATSAFPDYVEELMSLYGRRRALAAMRQGIDRLVAFEDGSNPEEVLAKVEGEISEAIGAVQHKPLARPWLSGVVTAVKQINVAMDTGKAVGVSTGLQSLDKVVGAMGDGDYVVVAGRPGMGKSALALNIAAKAALRGEGVFFGSLEMTSSQLVERALSQVLSEKGVNAPYSDMRRGKLDAVQYRETLTAALDMENLPIYTCDPSCRQLPRFAAAVKDGAARLNAMGAPMRLIVVDYLQLVDPVGRYRAGDTNGRVTAASAAMKAMAMHYGCPVLVLSQLSRYVENRDPPVPMLSDLRDSGSIEQDADVVIFAYRAEYYLRRKIEAAEAAGKPMGEIADLQEGMGMHRNKMRLIVAKQRTGAPGTASVHCEIEKNVITDEPWVDHRQQEMEGFG